MKVFVYGKKTMIVAKLLVFLSLALLVFWWFRFSPVKVKVLKLTRGTLVNEVMGTGTLEARVHFSLSPKISGLLVQVLADQNDRVKKGQLLACLDDGELLQQVEVAKADLAAAKASINLADAEITRSRATLVQTQANYERILTLSKSGVSSQSEMDKAIENKDVAESNFKRAGLAKLEVELIAVKTEANLRYNQERLKDCKLFAPYDGLVLRRNRDPGNVVVPGTSILDIISTDQLWISAWVDETAMGDLQLEQRARIIFRSEPENPVEGKLVRLASETDRETREFLADVEVDFKRLPKTWAIGQRAEVYIETERRNDILAIPSKFINWRDGEPFVMIADKGKAKWRKIVLGLKGKDKFEIKDGLLEGQFIIEAQTGALLPRDGRAVRHGAP
jgi:HlyD family secretion protein